MTSSHESDYIVNKCLQYLILKKLTIGIRHLKDKEIADDPPSSRGKYAKINSAIWR